MGRIVKRAGTAAYSQTRLSLHGNHALRVVAMKAGKLRRMDEKPRTPRRWGR